jgi:hypothetical protein
MEKWSNRREKGNEGEDQKESDKKKTIKKCQGAKRMAPMETCLEMILVVNWNVHWGSRLWKGDGRTDLWRWLPLA